MYKKNLFSSIQQFYRFPKLTGYVDIYLGQLYSLFNLFFILFYFLWFFIFWKMITLTSPLHLQHFILFILF